MVWLSSLLLRQIAGPPVNDNNYTFFIRTILYIFAQNLRTN